MPGDFPTAKDVKVGGKTLKDTTEVDEFFKLLIPEINGKIIGAEEVHAEMQPQNGATSKTHTSELAPDNVSTGDDLPFTSPYFQRVPFLMLRKNNFWK